MSRPTTPIPGMETTTYSRALRLHISLEGRTERFEGRAHLMFHGLYTDAEDIGRFAIRQLLDEAQLKHGATPLRQPFDHLL